jgi:adenylate cyclase
MLQDILRKTVSSIIRIGADSSDTDEIRVQKAYLALSICLCICAGVIWGAVYFAFREPIAGLCPSSFAVLLVFNLIIFRQTKRTEFPAAMLGILSLLVPFGSGIVLGGFANSGAVVLWSMLAPLGYVLVRKPSKFILWMLAYAGLLILSSLLEPYLRPTNNLPPALIRVLFVINLGGVSGFFALLLYYFVSQKNVLQEKADNLLLNILPKEIAAILKNENRTVADYYEGASILFADIVNFTPLSAMMTPIELVELLNEVFSLFDTLVEKYGLEKIKTIGDCYMVAAGIPRPRSDHAHVLTHLALDIRDYASQREFRGKRLAFRIGVNSGPVVAGVIGRKKFIYDLWGDTVNTASRMESQGAGGFIQITDATFNLIKDDFICEPRGVINVKGKGEMNVWYVLEKRAER